MYNNYKNFLKDFDEVIRLIYENQKEHIYCRKGCSQCCKKGDYPFSQLEFGYLMQGFSKLPADKKFIVKQKIKNLLENKKSEGSYEHECPFLIKDECSVYEYRGIVCRTFGLCYYDEDKKYTRLPDCVYSGLNFSKVFDKDKSVLNYDNVAMVNLRIDRVLNSELASNHGLFCSEIRPMLEWLSPKEK